VPSTPEPVSIVIPAYNAEAFLAEAIESALGQTHQPVEVVVVDDGSVDGTSDVIRSFGDSVQFVQKENGGTASARNAGARRATGRWIVFLDADDRLHPPYVERCLQHLGEHPSARYVYTQERFFGDLEYVSSYPPFDSQRLVYENFVNPSALLPRDVVIAHPFTEGQRTHEDWDFYLKLLREGMTGVLLDEPLKDYRRHADSKQARAGTYSVRMPMARLRIHVRHRDLLGEQAARVLSDDVARVARGAVRGIRTWLSLAVRRRLRR
jgi:glycosyltransferase involved in cell wall biosynthesis